MNKYQIGEKDSRPWGTWEVLEAGQGYCLKRLILNPSQQISKQRHKHRTETWIIVAGSGKILIGENWHDAQPGSIFRIPKYEIHQLKSSAAGITVIELQQGEILVEEDIERFS